MEAKVINLSEREKEGKVVETIPLTEEWTKLHDNLLDLSKQHREICDQREFAKKKMWIVIEEQSGKIGKSLRINREQNVVEILED